MPLGCELTVPAPVTATLSAKLSPVLVTNCVVTFRACDIVTLHVAVAPEHAPPHAENIDPAAGVAVKVITAFVEKFALQAVPQLIPAGCEVTVPLPVLATVNLNVELPPPPPPPPPQAASVSVTIVAKSVRSALVFLIVCILK